MSIRSDSTIDSSLARSLRESRERAYRASMQVDTIIVHPDTLTLRVGHVVELFSTVVLDARTATGQHVDHFAPLFEVGDQSIAGFSGPGLEGRKEGLTWLVVSAFAGDEPNRRILAKSMIWILVKP